MQERQSTLFFTSDARRDWWWHSRKGNDHADGVGGDYPGAGKGSPPGGREALAVPAPHEFGTNFQKFSKLVPKPIDTKTMLCYN